jgi:hypothetical protein
VDRGITTLLLHASGVQLVWHTSSLHTGKTLNLHPSCRQLHWGCTVCIISQHGPRHAALAGTPAAAAAAAAAAVS